MNNELISVIVPVYKVEKYLHKCVESIINQTYKNFEIILVDDGSPDNCPAICDEYAKKDSRIKVIHKENGGVSSARNVGIEKAQGKFIFFIDSDDYIDVKVIELLIENHQSKSLTGVMHKNVFLRKEQLVKYDNLYTKDAYIESFCKGQVMGNIWGMLFEKSMIGDLRFDEKISYMEDTIFLLKYLVNIDRIIFIKENQLYYYVFNVQGLTSGDTVSEKKIKMLIRATSLIEDIVPEKYYTFINEKKILLLESECTKKNKRVKILPLAKEMAIKKYEGNNKRAKLFYIALSTNAEICIRAYCFALMVVKNIVKKLK